MTAIWLFVLFYLVGLMSGGLVVSLCTGSGNAKLRIMLADLEREREVLQFEHLRVCTELKAYQDAVENTDKLEQLYKLQDVRGQFGRNPFEDQEGK